MPRSLTATVAAAIMLVVTACGSGSGDRPRADLGQTRIVLAAAASGGGAATPEALARASEVLARRFTDAGLPDPLAELTDSGLVVTLAGEADEQLVRSLVVPGELRFRKVLAVDEQFGSSVPPPPAPVPLDDQRTRREREAAVTEKVGEAAMAAVQSFVEREPADRYANELRTALEAFQALTPAEVAVLPATFQFHVSKIGCGRLNARPHGAVLETQQVVAACDDTPTKYLLDAAAVTGANVADAEASLESTAGQWVVTLSFTRPARTGGRR